MTLCDDEILKALMVLFGEEYRVGDFLGDEAEPWPRGYLVRRGDRQYYLSRAICVDIHPSVGLEGLAEYVRWRLRDGPDPTT